MDEVENKPPISLKKSLMLQSLDIWFENILLTKCDYIYIRTLDFAKIYIHTTLPYKTLGRWQKEQRDYKRRGPSFGREIVFLVYGMKVTCMK